MNNSFFFENQTDKGLFTFYREQSEDISFLNKSKKKKQKPNIKTNMMSIHENQVSEKNVKNYKNKGFRTISLQKEENKRKEQQESVSTKLKSESKDLLRLKQLSKERNFNESQIFSKRNKKNSHPNSSHQIQLNIPLGMLRKKYYPKRKILTEKYSTTEQQKCQSKFEKKNKNVFPQIHTKSKEKQKNRNEDQCSPYKFIMISDREHLMGGNSQSGLMKVLKKYSINF